jgi:hypothetical protein
METTDRIFALNFVAKWGQVQLDEVTVERLALQITRFHFSADGYP